MNTALEEHGAGEVSAGRQHNRPAPGFGGGVYSGLNRGGVEFGAITDGSEITRVEPLTAVGG